MIVLAQHDVADLSDDDIRRMVVRLRDAADGAPMSARRFTDRLAVALVRVLQERRRLLSVAELELSETDDEGTIVGADDDPIGEAMDELRRGPAS